MSTELLTDIAIWLTHQNIVGGSTGWPIFIGFMPPDDPNNPSDQMISIFETSGEQPDIVRDPSIGEKPFDTPGFQVRGRSAVNDYPGLRAQMTAIFNALHENEPPSSQVSGANYIYIYAKAGILPLGKDEQNRDQATQNYTVMRQR